MELLFIPQLKNEKLVPATVLHKGFVIANTTAFITSQIVISAGIPLCPSVHATKLAAVEPKKGV